MLIVNDRPLVRQGLRALLEREGEFCVCGEAEDIVSALRVFEFCPPDIVIVGMPPRDGEGSGLELIANIHMRSVETPVLVQTTLDDPAHAERCLVAGAQGFITEDQAMDKVADAVRHLLAGGIYLTPGMTAALLARYRGGNSASEVPGIKTLSNRELEVFELIGRGKTTREIATELQRSVKTVETHRLRIREKLQLLDTAKLACEAARWVMEKERREPLEL